MPAAKKTAKSTTEKSNGADTTSLADICKGLKKEPRWARRVLRNAKFKNPGHRWDFSKGDATKVKKILTDAMAE